MNESRKLKPKVHLPSDQPVQLRCLNLGDLFRFTKQGRLWVRGEFVREEGLNMFSCYKYDDINHESFFPGVKKVYPGENTDDEKDI